MSSLPRSVRRTLVAGGAVLILGGAAVGIAAAQAQPPSTTNQPTTYQKFVTALAARLGIDQSKVETAISQARTDAGMPAGGGFPGAGPRGPRGGPGREAGFNLTALATFLGTTPQDLRTALQTKSLAQVGADHNKTVGEVTNELKTEASARIDQAVAAGRLTADRANQMKASLDQRISQFVNQVRPAGGAGRRGNGLAANR